ncbi:MAG: PLDc N-terminal domain-containing protein, partial [Anaerotignum sp.]|nr:PLDc N-terminal domain-containing protein [Anaerotignum sp.]
MTGGVLNWLLLIGFIILVANIILSGLIVFFERRNPSSTWAWLLVLLFVPVLGFVVYMVFGRNSRREKMFLQKEDYDRSVYHNDAEAVRRNREQKKILRNNERLLENEYVTDLIHMHLNSGSWLTFNNRIDYYNNGRDKFDALIEDIRGAKKHIHLEYYIWRGDKLGKMLADELMKKVKEGVEVRVLYDGIGNSRLPKHFFEELEAAGGYTAAFLPRFVVRLNYRNHRKLAIIDGEIGYIGGFNVGDEYLGIKKRYGNWRDTHLRFRGGAVEQMQLRFLKDWNFTS